MTIGSNRSPYQTFPRSDFEPFPSDKDLLPKPVVERPGLGDLLVAPDIEGLPWKRDRGQEWTDATFRAEILNFIRQYFASRSGTGLLGWSVVERASERAKLAVDDQYLQFTLRIGVGDSVTEKQVSVSFPEGSRTGVGLQQLLSALEASLDAVG